MFKQTDAVIIILVLAAVVGVFVLSGNTASLIVVAALATVFGGLVGVRLRGSQAAQADNAEHNASTADQAVRSEASAGETAASVPTPEPDTIDRQNDGTISAVPAATTVRPPAAGEDTAASQVALLKNLVASVSEGITFKNPQGRYISANAAFAQMLDSRPSEIVGRDDAGVFGHLTAKSLLESDGVAAAHGWTSTTLEVPLPSGARYFEITKSSVNNDDDSLEGIVAVWRDVTEAALHRIRREKAMRETIADPVSVLGLITARAGR